MTGTTRFTNRGATRFYLVPHDNTIKLIGGDDDGEFFHLTLDRIWAANLHMELDDWLTGESITSETT